MAPDRPPFRHNQPAIGQRVVRAGALDRELMAHDADIGQKVAIALSVYHLKHVEPRLAWLEMPFYGKLWVYAKRAWVWLASAVKVEHLDKTPAASPSEKPTDALPQEKAMGPNDAATAVMVEGLRRESPTVRLFDAHGRPPSAEVTGGDPAPAS